jgi:hypothetical protein
MEVDVAITIGPVTDVSNKNVPIMYGFYPKKKREYPISERENIMRCMRHEKPLWMPAFMFGLQMVNIGDGEHFMEPKDFVNDWGIYFKWSDAQMSQTPVGHIFNEITEWRSIKFPKVNYAHIDDVASKFVRDENLALCTHLGSAGFEHIHMSEGFEQCLIDMITEPDECRAYINAVVDVMIENFTYQQNIFHYDFAFYHDDWGTMRGPFFSTDTMKEVLLEPTKRICKAISDTGCKVFFHICGKVDPFIPYLVEEVGADALEIQTLCDIPNILKTYGDKVTVELSGPERVKLHDPDTTVEEVRQIARDVVDQFGAHVNPGSGVLGTLDAPTEEKYYALEDEMISYSMEKYKTL